MKKFLTVVCLSGMWLLNACSNSQDMIYRPYPQILPQHVAKLSVQTFINKTEYFGLEDKLTLRVIDEFLRNSTYPIVPESESDGVIVGEIRRYILVPIQYDAAMVPTSYKLTVVMRVRFFDRASNAYLWEEPAFEGVQVYSAPTLPGGMTEEQARQAIWGLVAKDIVKRTVQGFGSVSSQSQKRLAPTDPVQVSTSTAQ